MWTEQEMTSRNQKIWQLYRQTKYPSMYNTRIGFYNYQVTDFISPVEFRPESGAEHMYGCMTLLLAITDLYPDLLTADEERAMIYAMQFHDAGEPYVGGDVADNGNRAQDGQDAEAEHVRSFLQLLTQRSSEPALRLFDDFEADHQTKAGRIMLLIDKMEFFLQAMAYMEDKDPYRSDSLADESLGIGTLCGGRVWHGYEPSAKELEYQELTGTDDIISLVAASIIDRYFIPILTTDWPDQSPGAVKSIVAIFQNLMRTVVVDCRGTWFPWAANEPFKMP